MTRQDSHEDKRITDEEALDLHSSGRPGKLEVVATKPLATQRDLSLAYSPGVAVPCLRIRDNPDSAYDYTARGNMVAVISNGTAVLGLGNLGALAGKPVMEGKAVLFKRFADIDAIDLEVGTEDIEEFINSVRYLGPSFGGINLEDIRAPDCFIIEQRLRELMDIPVFHDDQHGTAIVALAGLMNALELTGRRLQDVRVVVSGAGAAALACIDLIKASGLPSDHAIVCDQTGVIYQGRAKGMNQWKSAHAVDTEARTLADAIKGADVFLGLSVKGALTPEMVKTMAARPIIFALANPNPEILPEEVHAVRPDAIVATGRSDYPNQINNVLGFPYIFRGALDVRARTINEAMKIAAARALAELAREDVPHEVESAYPGRRLAYGPDYILPVPFDPRLITAIPMAVAESAVLTGVARRPLENVARYKAELRTRLDPSSGALDLICERLKAAPKRVAFTGGEEERILRAAIAFRSSGFGTPVVIGREKIIRERLADLGIKGTDGLEIADPEHDHEDYVQHLYQRLHRRGVLLRECARMVHTNGTIFAGLMTAAGHVDAMVTGATRGFMSCFQDVRKVLPVRSPCGAFGLTMLLLRGRMTFVADTSVHAFPTSEQLAEFARVAAAEMRHQGAAPRVAFLSHTNFGQSIRPEKPHTSREAVALLDQSGADFEYDGEMTAEVAMDFDHMRTLYPFCRLSGPANILIMPSLDAAHIATKLLRQTQGSARSTVIGPILHGLERPAQIVPMTAGVSEIVTMAILAASAVDASGAVSRTEAA